MSRRPLNKETAEYKKRLHLSEQIQAFSDEFSLQAKHEWAKKNGYTPNYVYSFFNGKRIPPVSAAQSLIAAIRKHIDSFAIVE